MTSLKELLDKGKTNFVSKHSITFINLNISSLGSSPLFDNIICLHLSRNQLKSLEGIGKFQLLRYFSVSFNLLANIEEFQNVCGELTNLSVIGNPLCINPDYEFKLINTFPELVQLDQFTITPQKRTLAHEVKAKLESYGLVLVALLDHKNQVSDLQGFLKERFTNIKEIIMMQQPYLNTFENLLKQVYDILNCQEDIYQESFLQQFFERIQNKEYQVNLLSSIFKVLQSTMKQDFNDSSLNTYYASLALQELDLLQFANDSLVLDNHMLNLFCQEGNNSPILQFPVYIFNQKYMMSLVKMIGTTLFSQRQQEEQQTKPPIITKLQQLSNKKVPFQYNEQLQDKVPFTSQQQQMSSINQISKDPNDIIQEFFSLQIQKSKQEFKIRKATNLLSLIVKRQKFKELRFQIKLKMQKKSVNLLSGLDKIQVIFKRNQIKSQRGLMMVLKGCKLIGILSDAVVKRKYFYVSLLMVLTKQKLQMENDRINQHIRKNKLRSVFKAFKKSKQQKRRALSFKKLSQKILNLKRNIIKTIWASSIQQNFEMMVENHVLQRQTFQHIIPSKNTGFLNSKAMNNFREQRDSKINQNPEFFYGVKQQITCSVHNWQPQ